MLNSRFVKDSQDEVRKVVSTLHGKDTETLAPQDRYEVFVERTVDPPT